MAEGGGLLNRYTAINRIVGSNPIPSATYPLTIVGSYPEKNRKPRDLIFQWRSATRVDAAYSQESAASGRIQPFDVVILLSSARIGISAKSSAVRRAQSMPGGAAPGRLIRIARVGVTIALSG